jgi:hypothetical protein
MYLSQKLGVILEKAQAMSKRIIKFGVCCIEWILTSIIAVIMGIAVTVAGAGQALYRARSKIVGTLLLVGTITLLLLWANQVVGFRSETERVHDWLMLDHHVAIMVGVVSFLVLTTWNYVSPTLRTLFSRGWSRIGAWILVSAALVAAAYTGLPQEGIAYRSAYAGTIIFYIVVLAVIAKKPPKDFVLSESFYVEDNPTGREGAEVYETQKRLIADIKYIIAGAQPSVFAISGRWGIGKTFLLLRAQHELVQDKTIIWMKFEPWRYASEEALIRGFYQDIGTTLAKKMPGVQNITKPLAEATDKFISQRDGTGILGAVMDVARTISRPAENPEVQIPELLTRERKRLVIVIDDVERSFDAERIFRTLQLAHYAKNIKNVQVVFLCDKDVVLKARPAHFGDPSQDATEYLEKFIGREVSVPSPRPPELRQHFTALMEVHRDMPGFDFNEDDLPEDMLNALGTPRGIIRLFNEFAAFRVNLEGSDNEP